MAPDRVRRHDQGFTLLEVLVAFLIAAMALAVLFRATVESRNNLAVAARYQEALARARSRLAAIEAAPLFGGDRQGDDGGGFRWRVRTAAVQAGPPTAAGLAPALFSVSVAVSWTVDGRERAVQLDTMRVGLAEKPPP